LIPAGAVATIVRKRNTLRGGEGGMIRTHRVLAVDDSVGVLTLIGTYLQGSEFVFAGSARDGKSAVDRYTKLKPDIVLLDIVMPEQGGPETLKQILAINPVATVAMISSLAGDDVVQECTRLGARSYLKKPFTKDGLLEFLRKLVGSQ
jgi:two-component system chemotaxis response regulator CheY